MNTVINLVYKDAAGWGQSEDVVLDGAITDEQLQIIKKNLGEDGECIIAHQVDLPTPSENFDESSEFPTEDDHVWTTIEQFQHGTPTVSDFLTDDEPTEQMTIAEFVAKIDGITWDIEAEMDRLQIPL